MTCKDGEIQVLEAITWIHGHKQEWLRLQEICLRLEAATLPNGNKRFATITRGSVYILAQIIGLEVTEDATFKRNNNLWSTLSRYLVELHPALERVIQPRECEVARWVRMNGLPELDSTYIYK